jgi:hypothetical protein
MWENNENGGIKMENQNNGNGRAGAGAFNPAPRSTRIVDLPCTLCWAAIGEKGIVKGMVLDGVKVQIALCEKHQGTQISEVSENV